MASSSLAVDGLASGLDTTSIINAQIAVDAIPQTLLKTKLSSTQSLVSSLQTLNSVTQTLATTARAAAGSAAMSLFSATSSVAGITATAGATAQPGSISFTVDALSARQTSVSAAGATFAASAQTLTFVKADGTRTEITPASGSMDDVAAAINSAKAGYTAISVKAGTDGSGTQLYRLQISSTTDGAAGAFSLYRGSGADIDAGVATDVLAETGAATTTAASDAKVTLWAGTAAQQSVTSATNTFTGLLTGVDVTVSAVQSTAATLSIAQDTAGITKVASGIVSSLSTVLGLITTKSAVSTTTDSTGASVTTGGDFTGDAMARQLASSLFSAASSPVGGTSPSSIGFVVGSDGTITFDQDKFQAALAADPAGTEAMVQTIAGRVADVAEPASDQYTGSITQRITAQQSDVKDLNLQIEDWDRRLAARKSALQDIYTNLETQLSTLKTQSTYLTSQIAALPSWNTSTSSNS